MQILDDLQGSRRYWNPKAKTLSHTHSMQRIEITLP